MSASAPALAVRAGTRPVPTHTPNPIAALVYCAVTHGGIEDWLRFRKTLRMSRLATRVLVIVGVIVVKELLSDWAADTMGGG